MQAAMARQALFREVIPSVFLWLYQVLHPPRAVLATVTAFYAPFTLTRNHTDVAFLASNRTLLDVINGSHFPSRHGNSATHKTLS